MIILNEKAEAEKIIATGEFGDSLSDALSLIARYYYSKGLSAKNIYSELDKFMQENVPDYNPVLWKEMLDRKVKKAGKHLSGLLVILSAGNCMKKPSMEQSKKQKPKMDVFFEMTLEK